LDEARQAVDVAGKLNVESEEFMGKQLQWLHLERHCKPILFVQYTKYHYVHFSSTDPNQTMHQHVSWCLYQ